MTRETPESEEAMHAHEEQKMYERAIVETPAFKAAVQRSVDRGVGEDDAQQSQLEALQINPRREEPLDVMVSKSFRDGLEERTGSGKDQFLAGYKDFRASKDVRRTLVAIRDGVLKPDQIEGGLQDAVDGIIQRDLDDRSVYGTTLLEDIQLIQATGRKLGIDLLAHSRDTLSTFLADVRKEEIAIEHKPVNFEAELETALSEV